MAGAPAVKKVLIHPVNDSYYELSYGKKQATQGGVKTRPDHLDWEVVDSSTQETFGSIRLDSHSRCVRAIGIKVVMNGIEQWVKLPGTKFTSELDAVQALRMTIAVMSQIDKEENIGNA